MNKHFAQMYQIKCMLNTTSHDANIPLFEWPNQTFNLEHNNFFTGMNVVPRSTMNTNGETEN